MLLSVIKIIATTILECIGEHHEGLINREQRLLYCRSFYTDHINTELIWLFHLLFIDFEKNFEKVDRERIWSAPSRSDIPKKLVGINRTTNDRAKCQRDIHVTTLRNKKSKSESIRVAVQSLILFLLIISEVRGFALVEGRYLCTLACINGQSIEVVEQFIYVALFLPMAALNLM